MLDLSYALAGETRDPFFVPGKEAELISFFSGLLIGATSPLGIALLPMSVTNAALTFAYAVVGVLLVARGVRQRRYRLRRARDANALWDSLAQSADGGALPDD